MAWLSGWDKRVKLPIDQNDIDAALSNFPVLVHLGTSVGRNGDDVSFVFDELQSDANRKKIAVTTSDGETQCYVEIEKWDDANEQAWLWVKIPTVASDADTDLYLYYDKTQPDNTTYVGDPNDAVVHNVWDSDFKLVSHMRDDPDNEHIRDSTVNANDGTKKGAGEPVVTPSGKIDDAQDFESTNTEYISATTGLNPIRITCAAWVKPESISAMAMIINKGFDGSVVPWTLILSPAGYTNKFGFGVYGGPWHVAGGTTIVVLSDWYYVVGVFDGSFLRIYVNGLEEGTLPWITDLSSNTQPVAIGAGKWNANWQFPYDGIIDEVRISDTARTAPWIKASHESERDHLLDFGSEELAPVAAYYKDIATHFKSTVQAFKNIATRFNLTVQGFQDIATRFKLTTAVLPTVITKDATEITTNSAKLWGEITGL